MASVRIIRDDSGRTLAKLISCHDEYRLPDGSTMFISTRAAWCLRCRAVVLVEELADPVALEHEAHDSSGSPVFLRQLLHEATQWRAALKERTSPPRCLECAGTEFVLIPDDGTFVEHPENPSRKIREDQMSASFVDMRTKGRIYNVEGMCVEFD